VSANWKCQQGWTRISDFGDLNALSEADWDKVAIWSHDFWFSKRLLIRYESVGR